MILKLEDLLKQDIWQEMGVVNEPLTFSYINLDEVFMVLRKRKIEAVRVNFDQMFKIMNYMLANARVLNDEDRMWEALKIMQEGKVDKFLGIKLILEE